MSYWSSKWHGFHWGWYQQKPNTTNEWMIDNYEVCDNICTTDGSRHMFKFGNEWGEKTFQHPRVIPHNNWHFIDNPQLSALNWIGSWNPSGSKDWVRAVPGDILTQTPRARGGERINRLLDHYSDRSIRHWHEIVQSRPRQDIGHNTALIVPSSPNCYVHYYNDTQPNWVNTITKKLDQMGWQYKVRMKPGRSARKHNNELHDQLESNMFAVTISQHSVAAIDSLLAGIPAVTTGPHCCGEYATPWEEFTQGNLRHFTQEQILDWCDWLLGDTYHKSELKDGTYRS